MCKTRVLLPFRLVIVSSNCGRIGVANLHEAFLPPLAPGGTVCCYSLWKCVTFLKQIRAEKELRTTDLGAKAQQMERVSGTVRTRTVSRGLGSASQRVLETRVFPRPAV